ncbi:cytochrome c550 [Texcoconibacillus texcoconensis]|uniref:Mono/diheme cytochrome c family protein n=1 Tax=Texcoconibacillus texcoconensis TaxID=1095777 RepID=A0A840QRH6_9BACI|nr:cytochrome c [Texcoconibacillus texcoconensis]MBB5173921.1 mono/diheme cytochrome c family protein [Texcoconibacillus texcoconensis]
MKGKPLYPFAATAVLGVLLILILSFVGVSQQQEMAEEGDENGTEEVDMTDPIAYGEDLYQDSCIGCHGENLEGAGSNPAIHDLEGRLSQDEIVDIIENGQGSMPAGLETGENAEAIAEYLLDASE